MTKSDLFKEILPKLVDYLRSQNTVTEAEKDGLQANLDLDSYDEVCDTLIAHKNIGAFEKLIQYIKDSLTDLDEVNTLLPIRHVETEEKNRGRLADLAFKNNDLTLMTVKAISSLLAYTGHDNNYKKIRYGVIELVLLKYKDDPNGMQYFWECCSGQHENDYILLSNQPNDDTSNWRLYSYAYLCYVNENRFDRPVCLNFTASTHFAPSIIYNATNRYEQYFDAYGVMSESKYAEDVLSRYLRMYQLLEYFGYRRALADMTKGNIKENGFVRNVISKASKGSAYEFDELKKGLQDVLPDLSYIITAAEITADMRDFIKDRLMIKNQNHDNAKLWEVVYKLRNCIVHNKESELHFTYANTSVYTHGIALMKLLIEKIEPAIIGVINNPGETKLEFDKQVVEVY